IRAGFPFGDVGSGHAYALRAVELQTPDSPLWPAVCWPLAMACFYRGDLDAADRWFEETSEAAARNDRWLIAVSAVAHRSLTAGDSARPDQQHDLAEQAAALARDRGVDESSGEVHVAIGCSLAARGELDAALPELARGVAVLRSLGRPLELANALIRQVPA